MSDIVLPLPELTDETYFDVASARAALADGLPVSFPAFELLHVPQMGLNLCLNMQRDPIQNAWRKGTFFEAEELESLKRYVKDDAHVIDIGANVGNHALFFATRMHAARVLVIEPTPLALAPLMANVLINHLEGVIDLSLLGVGLSDRSQAGFGMKRHDRNLGATKMFEGKGDIDVHAGDDLLGSETPDLIKIDVEGMEMKVLSGLRQTIATHRPVILIEVDESNATAFEDWRVAHDYVIAGTVRHSRKNCNYVLVAGGAL
ncbi:FkbM family methyltransferase [Roseovarius dicentrarchi]|uniref:FkbM family methyltransferase n=1 Tax=Roseovarius dicentrarchi TaxID=2250573 RepID=UPI001EEFBF5F|nr:FkbM family methyltransferase [Roseovarius dicentrarchi]